jgi:hypothetical protein
MVSLIKKIMARSFDASVLLVLVLPGLCYAAVEEDETVEKTEIVKEKKSVSKKTVCDELRGESDSWLDVAHTYLSAQFCGPAAWFDDFFSSERVDEEAHPGTNIRWRNDFVNTEGQGFNYITSLSAKFRLPKAKKKLNLIFEGEQEEAVGDIVPANRDETKANLGLLYELKKSRRQNISLRVKLSPSITLRYRYAYPITETFLTRLTEEVFRRKGVDGHTTRIDFEKNLSQDFFLRQSNAATLAENIDGTDWETSLVLFQRLSDVSALSYESSVVGLTRPDDYVTNSRLGVRYRRNFHRKWLFYELVPAVNWPRELITDERIQVWEFMFRLEVNFSSL